MFVLKPQIIALYFVPVQILLILDYWAHIVYMKIDFRSISWTWGSRDNVLFFIIPHEYFVNANLLLSLLDLFSISK